MKVFVVLVVFSVLFQASAGSIWGWLTTDDAEAAESALTPEEDITEECLQLASWGQCAFYDCMERRFGCGDEGYTNRISKHFCTKIDDNYESFDDFGKLWLNRTSVCLINFMVPLYRQNQVMCSDIQAAGIEAILNCNGETVNGRTFCDFLQTNGAAYNGLMGREEVMLMLSLRDPRVFQSMVSDAVGCGVQRIGQTMSSLGSSVRELGGSMYSSVRSWFT